MIISRLPLYNNQGTIGYFEYGACLFPNGQVDQQMYFFNETDIDKVYFKGYEDKAEEQFQKKYQEEIKDIKHTKLTLMHENNAK